MEPSLKLSKKNELNIPIFKHLLNDMISIFGAVEITIKPQSKLNTEILNRIKSIEDGDDMIYFNLEEFEKMSQDLLEGNKPNIDNLIKVHKNEKGHIVSSISI